MFTDYTAIGWKLCGIEPGKKGPLYSSWNEHPIPDDAVEGLDGAGLLHALSGTCALDLDNTELARPWLAERGVDMDELLTADDAVKIMSGRHNRAKLIYRIGAPMRTIMLSEAGIELRCATAEGKSVQDALPPTVHPVTKKPYYWECGIVGDWRNLPAIPAALLAAWREAAARPDGARPGPQRRAALERGQCVQGAQHVDT